MNKCKGCEWHNKPYWSIINPCEHCTREEIQTFTRWQDPTIEEYKKEIQKLNNIIDELEKYFAKPNKFIERPERMKILDKLKDLKEGK